jgi:hypothetical protein
VRSLQTDAIWNEARALLEEQLTLAESMVKAHQEGTSDLFKARSL